MNKIKLIIGIFTLILSVGCMGTKNIIKEEFKIGSYDKFDCKILDYAGVTSQGLEIFKSKLYNNLRMHSLLDESSNKLIEVTFTNYYVRHGATRALVGVLAGADNITSKIVIKDKMTNEVYGEFQVVSKNATAMGTARGLIEQHADEIVLSIVKNK